MYFAPGTEVNYATMNIQSPSASAAFEQGILDGDSSVAGVTVNIDSVGASGATIPSHGDSPSLGFSGQRLPPAGARQPQASVILSPNGSMYFPRGAKVNSPTLNIRSYGASGAKYS